MSNLKKWECVCQRQIHTSLACMWRYVMWCYFKSRKRIQWSLIACKLDDLTHNFRYRMEHTHCGLQLRMNLVMKTWRIRWKHLYLTRFVLGFCFSLSQFSFISLAPYDSNVILCTESFFLSIVRRFKNKRKNFSEWKKSPKSSQTVLATKRIGWLKVRMTQSSKWDTYSVCFQSNLLAGRL